MDGLDGLVDLANGQRWPPVVTARALDEYQLHCGRELGKHTLYVYAAVRAQGYFAVTNAKVPQRTVPCLSGQTDDLFQRVVGFSGGRQHLVAGAKDAVETQRQRVRTRGDLRPHERVLRLEDEGEEPGERVAADVVVAIAGRGREVARGHAVFLKGAHHAAGI